MVDGRIVVKGGRLITVRKEAVMRNVEPISKRMRRYYRGILKTGPQSRKLAVRNLYRSLFNE